MMRQAASDLRASRRTARSNYLDLEDDLALFEHLESLRTPPATASTTRQDKGVLGIFEVLQRKFGFQSSSVANQKENFACWIANYQLRYPEHERNGQAAYQALWKVHQKFFKNYVKWCKFLGAEPHIGVDGAPMAQLEKQIALFLCLWGEAGNLRFMPECICFLYHSMAMKLPDLEALDDMPEGYYLQRIVRPVYNVVAKMRTAASADPAKPLDHQDVRNYDDVNEFFWRPACLDFDELNIADVLTVKDSKTFREKRSVFNPLLAFYRIWFFLLVVFHTLLVISYVGYYTRDDGADGFAYYANWWDTAQTNLRDQAIFSIFLTVTGLQTLKATLEVWLFDLQTFNDFLFALGSFARLIWHTTFFGLFILVSISPYEQFLFGASTETYLSCGYLLILTYCVPVGLSAIVRMCCGKGVWSIRLLNSLDGTRRQYIGREMAQPWKPFMLYSLSWIVIFFLKFLFTLELMIKPLVGPSIEIYNTSISSKNAVFESNHNLLFIGALWAPVLVVYLYDSQIWFILYQSIVGLVTGLKNKMGHFTNMEQMKIALYTAPLMFDRSVASLEAQKQVISSTTPTAREDSLQLRFAIIWNEIISTFRLNDLLDDRETVILQYRVLDHGHTVQNPIFLLAGKLAKAVEIASKSHSEKWSSAELQKHLEDANVTDAITDGLNLIRHIFYLLLGSGEEGDGALGVLEFIYNSTDIVALMNFKFLPELVDDIVELLAVILDLPEDLSAVERTDAASQSTRVAFHDQTRQVIEKLKEIFRKVEIMTNDSSVKHRLEKCAFVQVTTDLTFQKQQLLSLYKADAAADSSIQALSNDSFVSPSTSKFAREDFISSCTRLFFLLRLDVAQSQPRCEDARRRLRFFLHSLGMDMPKVNSIEAMPSFSVMTPYYSETVLFTLDELKNPVHSNPLFERIDGRYKEKGRNDLTIMNYLITFHAEEWSNFLERLGVESLEEAIAEQPMAVRLWASMRGQTLARTVYGMMMYEDALRILRWLELWNDQEMDEAAKVSDMNRISSLKFSYITGCQIYSQQVEKGDHRAADIDFLMKRFPSWRVSFVDTVKEHDGEKENARYDCVLVKAEGDEIVEVYRYELPGNPILGEGKPENQNVALPFTRGEYLQTIDMNQEHYFEETLKMPNFLATAQAAGEDVTIIGMKEHVFTGRASSLARFMTLQELVFVTLTQRVLASPLRSRMHYGHPDVFEKSFAMTNGGVSKASKGINLSEDVFSGYNVTLRGGLVTHVEFMQCGKGRDVTLSQINAFEAKLSNGCAESCLSREGHRMSNNLDFFRLNSMFYGHFGFYICNALTVLCVYIYAYSKLYIATHNDVVEGAAANTKQLDSLAKVMSTQYVLQFGLLTTLPLFSTLLVEFGWKQAAMQLMELISALGIVFYVFLTGTKAHYYDVALIRGGSKYRGTGRGFAITRDPMVKFFQEYGVSHFRKAVELIGVMIIYGIYGIFDVGANAKDEYCATASFDCDERPDLIPKNITTLEAYSVMPQSYGISSFAVLLLGACWLLAPFVFNTDGLVLEKTKVDVLNWFAWMMRVKGEEELTETPEANPNGGTPGDGWLEWWRSDVDLMLSVGPMGRLTYMIRELRHPLAMYYVFVTHFDNGDLWLLVIVVAAIWSAAWLGNFVTQQSCGRNQKQFALSLRGVLFMVLVLGGIAAGPLLIGVIAGWSVLKGLTLSISVIIAMIAICQYAVALHGIFGLHIAMWSPFVTLGFIYDMLVGVFLVVPLMLLSFLPFMRILQTRMLFNGGFARSLASGSEVAASICIMVGLTGGYIYGFVSCYVLGLGYINDPKFNFINRSLLYFISEEPPSGDLNLMEWVADGKLKAVCMMSAVGAILATLVVGKIFARRVGMVLGCASIATGLSLNFINSGAVIVTASCLITVGSVFLAVNYLLYSYEICTKGWRGKGVSMFLVGSLVGVLVQAGVQLSVNNTTINENEGNKPGDIWRVLPMYALLPVIIVFTGILRFIPESPVWYICKGDAARGRDILIRLRRRQNVEWEMAKVEDELKESKQKRSLAFRVCFVFALEVMVALLMSNSLIKREYVKDDLKADGDVKSSSWMVNFGIFISIGVVFSVFLIDNVRRKTILKDFLPFIALLSILCALLDEQGGAISGILPVVFIASGLSLISVTWLSSLEMFGAANRSLFFTLAMGVFYAVQGVIYYFSPSFALCHFVYGGSCALMTLTIFSLCASTKQGAIQLKSEKKRQKQEAEEQGTEADGRPSTIADLADQQAQMQQTRIAQVAQPRRPSTSHNLSNQTDVSSLHLANSTFNESNGSRIQLSMLNRTDRSTTQGSFHLRLNDDDYDAPPDLLQHEILNPRNEPRSISFLQSRTFPEAQLQAETRGRGVRL
ncbi:hypothetical protein Poli38472_014026 [Pythium oligandrum]|uniref:1,3-beta-glucan synthase n=1 Tax=Pythium oligandrum TaxID=41045 RepID=A0A8K1CNG3_PYTOL|nr:hypothetical protein Poli38472_014026 [Pythium oligandrum]|eukprot:TMW66714.1 hypothetical protein Poli38472_014026 [Pythium oligandrum]